MRLRTRLVLMVGVSVSVGVVAVAAVLGFLAWRSILAQAEAEGLAIARLLAQSATVSEQVVAEVGALLDREMIAQGVLAGQLADAALQSGMGRASLGRLLAEIAARSSIGELWIADGEGRVRAGSADDADVAARVTEATGLPDAALAGLLAGTRFAEPLGIGRQPLGGMPMRYVGVRNSEQAPVVVVGREQAPLGRLSQTMGVQRLLDALVRDRTVAALWVFGPDGHTVASTGGATPSPRETQLVTSVLGGGPARAALSGGWIDVAAAMPDQYGVPAGVALARLSTVALDTLFASYLRAGGATALGVLLVGILLSVVMGRRIAAPMMRIADAAGAVDTRSFVPGALATVTARRDELGYLARTFEVMAEQVFAREEDLERQVRQRTAELQLRNDQLDAARRRLEADLELARLLQSTILPQAFPTDRHWSGTACMTPAQQMAGDFYDYFPLDAHRLGLVIADVSGKGIAPAFFMAVSRSALQEAARRNDDPGVCLAVANDRLCEQNPLDMFVTVFYAIIDERNGTVMYANGGHNRPYVVADDGPPRAIPLTDGVMLGVMPDMPYASGILTLRPGETLFLYTDGVSEAMNLRSEKFGEVRLEAVLTQAAALPVDAMLEAVTDAVRDFAGAAPQSDDITCLVVRYLGDRIEYAPRMTVDA
ncbi:MAG: PP2C family protein-serine/threonine phosphatase [Acetobacteraceae bacterium]